MNWHWNVEWTVDPDSFWLWVTGIALALGILFVVISLIGGWLDEPGRSAPHSSRAEIARLGDHRSAIDEVYDRAELEVQRAIERGDGG